MCGAVRYAVDAPLELSGYCHCTRCQRRTGGASAVSAEVGTERVMKEGDFFNVPPGHDSWVVGDEPYVSLHFTGGERYALSRE